MPRRSGGNRSIIELQKQVAAMDLQFAEMKVKMDQDISSSQKCMDLIDTMQAELANAEKEKGEFVKRIGILENLVKTLREINQKQAEAEAERSTQLELEKKVLQAEIARLAMAARKRGNKRKAKGSSKKGNVNGKELKEVYKRVQGRLGGLIAANYSHFKPETGEGFPLRQQRSTEEDFEDGLGDYLDGIWDSDPEPEEEPEVAKKVELYTLPIYKSELDREELDRRWNEFAMSFNDIKPEGDEEIERKDQPDVGEKVEQEATSVCNGSETTDTDREERDRRWNEWALQFQMVLDDMETEEEDEDE